MGMGSSFPMQEILKLTKTKTQTYHKMIFKLTVNFFFSQKLFNAQLLALCVGTVCLLSPRENIIH